MSVLSVGGVPSPLGLGGVIFSPRFGRAGGRRSPAAVCSGVASEVLRPLTSAPSETSHSICRLSPCVAAQCSAVWPMPRALYATSDSSCCSNASIAARSPRFAASIHCWPMGNDDEVGEEATPADCEATAAGFFFFGAAAAAGGAPSVCAVGALPF